jgi:hypothetical protein
MKKKPKDGQAGAQAIFKGRAPGSGSKKEFLRNLEVAVLKRLCYHTNL